MIVTLPVRKRQGRPYTPFPSDHVYRPISPEKLEFTVKYSKFSAFAALLTPIFAAIAIQRMQEKQGSGGVSSGLPQ